MRHLTLLLLSVFTVHQAKADILIPLDKYPTGENVSTYRSTEVTIPVPLGSPPRHLAWMKMGRWETRRIGHPNKSTRTISR